jgi:hypothetical protein
MGPGRLGLEYDGVTCHYILELELIQTKMVQKPMLWEEVNARALRASQNAKRAEVWVGARCALWVGGSWASPGVECHVSSFFRTYRAIGLGEQTEGQLACLSPFNVSLWNPLRRQTAIWLLTSCSAFRSQYKIKWPTRPLFITKAMPWYTLPRRPP